MADVDEYGFDATWTFDTSGEQHVPAHKPDPRDPMYETITGQPPEVSIVDAPPWAPSFVSVADAVAEMERLAKLPLVQTGFATLDSTMTHGVCGLVSGQPYNIVAQTGRGKTSFVNRIAYNMASAGHEVVIAFYEAGAWYCIARMAAPVIGQPSNALMRTTERVDGVPKLKYGDEIIETIPDRIHLLNRPSTDSIERHVAHLAEKTGSAPIVVIDYAQKLADQIASTQLRPDARLAMSEASSSMLELADRTKATVLAVQSMSRMNGRRMRDVRKLAPFELVDVAKESGAVEYDAAGMIVLTLSDDYENDERIGTMTIAKARFGIECHVDMRFDGKSGLWRDLGRVEPEADDDVCDIVRDALLTGGPADNATDLVKRCKGASRKKLFAAVKEMTTETGEIVRNSDGRLELA